MESKQAKQNEDMLKNIENLLGNVLSAARDKNTTDTVNIDELNGYDIGYERLQTKSPITVLTKSNDLSNIEGHSFVENDVRNFVSQHIQDIVPDLVDQVQQEIGKEDDIILILPEANGINSNNGSFVDREDVEIESIHSDRRSVKGDFVFEHSSDDEDEAPNMEDEFESMTKQNIQVSTAREKESGIGEIINKNNEDTEYSKINSQKSAVIEEINTEQHSDVVNVVEYSTTNTFSNNIEKIPVLQAKTSDVKVNSNIISNLIYEAENSPQVVTNEVNSIISIKLTDIKPNDVSNPTTENNSYISKEKIQFEGNNSRNESQFIITESTNTNHTTDVITNQNIAITQEMKNQTQRIEQKRISPEVNEQNQNIQSPEIQGNQNITKNVYIKPKYAPQLAKKSKRTRKIYSMIKKLNIKPVNEVLSTEIHIIQNVDSPVMPNSVIPIEESTIQEVYAQSINQNDKIDEAQSNEDVLKMQSEPNPKRISKIPIRKSSTSSSPKAEGQFNFKPSNTIDVNETKPQPEKAMFNLEKTSSQGGIPDRKNYDQLNNKTSEDAENSSDYEDVYEETIEENIIEENLHSPQSTSVENDPNSKDDMNMQRQSQNLSDLVTDTQKLIQQMKNEIKTDIASLVSEDDYMDDSEEWTDDIDTDNDEYISDETNEDWSDLSSHLDQSEELISENDIKIQNTEPTKIENTEIPQEKENIVKDNMIEKNTTTVNSVSNDTIVTNIEKIQINQMNISVINQNTQIQDTTAQNISTNENASTDSKMLPNNGFIENIDQNDPNKLSDNLIGNNNISKTENVDRLKTINVENIKSENVDSKTENLDNLKTETVDFTASESIYNLRTVDNNAENAQLLNMNTENTDVHKEILQNKESITIEKLPDLEASDKTHQSATNIKPSTSTIAQTPLNLNNSQDIGQLPSITSNTLSKSKERKLSITKDKSPTFTLTPTSSASQSKTGAIKKQPLRRHSLTNQTQPNISKLPNLKSVQSRYMQNVTKPPLQSITQPQPIQKPTIKSQQNKASSFIKSITNKVTGNSTPKDKFEMDNTTSTTLITKNEAIGTSSTMETPKPRRKYVETCFSDNQTSDEDEPITPMPAGQRRDFFQITKSIDAGEALLQNPEVRCYCKFLELCVNYIMTVLNQKLHF